MIKKSKSRLTSENKRYRKLLKEVLQLGVFGYDDRSGIHAPEDPAVKVLCERYGYGAVMDSASRQWGTKCRDGGLPGSQHTVAACESVRISWIKRAMAALAGKDGE